MPGQVVPAVYDAAGASTPPPDPIGSDIVGSAQPVGEVIASTFAMENPPRVAQAVATEPASRTLTPAHGAPGSEPMAFGGESMDQASNRLYGSVDYLLWWFKDSHIPPLVTTGPPGSSGILGAPGTVVLFGGSRFDSEDHSGVRATIGYWLGDCQKLGIEASYFVLGSRANGFMANSNDFPVLARPFFNLNSGMEFSQVTASPNLSTGSITVAGSSRLWGAEVNARTPLCCGCGYRVDGFAGIRYLDLRESLSIGENIQVLPGVPQFGGDQITVLDSFGTQNQFVGGQIGVDAEFNYGTWFADVRGKLAIGSTAQTVDIVGNQLITAPDGTTTAASGGLLALSTNIGHHVRYRFGVVPEMGINLGYRVTDNLRLYLGYSFLYWNSLLRPGDQIDRVVDVTKIPNFPVNAVPTSAARPAVLFKDSEFWAQGINCGLEFRY
jgi:hypothetical protein